MAETQRNDLPNMYVGETRLVQFDWSGGAGENSLESVAYSSAPSGVTFTSSDVGDLVATAFITPASANCYKLIATGTLTSGEIITLRNRLKVIDPDCSSSSDNDYDG